MPNPYQEFMKLSAEDLTTLRQRKALLNNMMQKFRPAPEFLWYWYHSTEHEIRQVRKLLNEWLQKHPECYLVDIKNWGCLTCGKPTQECKCEDDAIHVSVKDIEDLEEQERLWDQAREATRRGPHLPGCSAHKAGQIREVCKEFERIHVNAHQQEPTKKSKVKVSWDDGASCSH